MTKPKRGTYWPIIALVIVWLVVLVVAFDAAVELVEAVQLGAAMR